MALPIPETSTSKATDKESRLSELLSRPLDQRVREYRYRFGQSIVFGLPVIALHFWGSSLGPVDSQRWSSLLQVLLCGWVVYVNLGMLFEGLIDHRLRFRGDFIVACIAVVLYLASLISALHGIIASRLWYPLTFHICIIILAIWSLWRWLRLSRAFSLPPRSV
jgi:hypothetical protein